VTPGVGAATRLQRRRALGLVFILYLAILLIDAIRKVTGLSSGIIGIVYALTFLVYIFTLPQMGDREQAVPRFLPLCLILLSLWCLANAITLRIPAQVALLGWVSYVFFVPLFYVAANLMVEDRHAAKALRVVAIGGAVVGVGAIGSALLGSSAPTLLQPIIPAVGVHSFNATSIYLSPSIFADGQEASEQLLIALFAWTGLAYLPSGGLRRPSSAVVGVLIVGGLIATEARTVIYIAVAGMVVLQILSRVSAPPRGSQLTSRTATAARRPLGAALILALAGSIALIFFLGAGTFVSFLTSGSPAARLTGMFSQPYSGALIGQGLGTSTQGANLVGATFFKGINGVGPYQGFIIAGRNFITTEGGLSKTWLELGILGVVLYGLIFLSALGPAIALLPRLDGSGRALAILTVGLGIVFLKNHQSLDNPLVQPLFWLGLGGVWGRMRALAARNHREAPAASSAVPAGGHSHIPTRHTDFG
jgi:hypothetical protein